MSGSLLLPLQLLLLPQQHPPHTPPCHRQDKEINSRRKRSAAAKRQRISGQRHSEGSSRGRAGWGPSWAQSERGRRPYPPLVVALEGCDLAAEHRRGRTAVIIHQKVVYSARKI